MKIARNFYAYFWQDPSSINCNTYVINGKIPILIDPGLARHAGKLTNSISNDKISFAQRGLIINTHGHPDHIEANTNFNQEGMLFTMHQKEEEFLQDVGKSLFLQMGMVIPELHINFYLQDGDLLVGEHSFQVIHTPGHSPGSICLFWKEYSALFTGDLIFANGIGRVELPGGEPEQMKQSLAKVTEFQAESIFPGHGMPVIGRDRVELLFANLSEYVNTYL